MITNKAPARLLVLSLLALVLVQRVGAGGAVQPLEVAQGDVAQLGVGQLRLVAEQGDARAQTELGARYENGRGVARDYRAAVSWFRRAAAQGYAPAQAALGFMYNTGRGVTRNDAVALSWHRRAAEQGNARAQNNLGIMYRDGRGVSRDDAEAVRWFRRAAEQGNGFAQNSLGDMYREGRGVPRDDIEAVFWFRRSAEQGNGFAQNNLGHMYERGRGVRQDDEEALRWFRRRAVQPGLHVPERPWRAPESHGRGPVVPSGRRTGPRRRAEGTGPRPVNLAGGVKHLERRAALMDAGPVMTHSSYNWRSDSVGRHRPARARDWRHLPSRSSVKRTASRPVTLASSSASSGVGCRPIG